MTGTGPRSPAHAAALLAALGAALALTGCPEEVDETRDRQPPTSTAYVTYPAGGRVDIPDGRSLTVATVEVRLHLELDEPGTVYYTTNDSRPDPSDAGRAENEVVITLSESTVVRWFGVDQAGNVEPERRVEVIFDREPPQLRIDPPPGEYAGRLQVVVSANEPGRVYWTVDGSPPVPGTGTTSEARLPADIELILPTELRLLGVDVPGNQIAVGPLAYVIDAEAPTTVPDPQPGRYLGPIAVTLTTDDPTAETYYTTDGSEPDRDAARYDGPIALDGPTTLTVRSYDEGGNAEVPQALRYQIGSRGPVAPEVGESATRFPFAGGLRLAAALVEVAGPLAGAPDAPSTGADWTAWSLGRTALDAALWQSGVGPHAMNGTAMIDLSAAGLGEPDENFNGSNLDETFFGRIDALAERVGESRVPDGLHPPTVLLAAGDAALAAALPARRTPLGRPAWTDDYGQMRWTGAVPDALTTGADVLAAGLRALEVRARSALAADHPIGEGDYARRAAAVVGLRCVSCHGVGVEPAITGPADLNALGLLDGADPPLLDLLSGAMPHPIDPATPEEVAAVADWIGDGAAFREDAARAPGAEPREGLLGLLAVEHAGQLIAEAAARLTYDVERNRLAEFDPARDQYVLSQGAVIIGAGPTGTPGLEGVTPADRTFRTAEQARLLRALVDWVALGEARPELFGGPLAGNEVFPSTPALARRMADPLIDGLLTRVAGPDGAPVASWNPGAGPEDRVDAAGLAEYAMAMRAAGAVLDVPAATAAADEALAFLRSELRLAEGDYADAWRDGAPVRGARQVATQWIVLRALLDAAEAGDDGARADAEALWGRIGAMWYDSRAGLWQTTMGLDVWHYEPTLVARTLDGLRAAARADLPGAAARLSNALDRLVIPFVWADTWLSGEITAGADVDGDGLPKPQDAGAVNGVAPVFRRAMSL